MMKELSCIEAAKAVNGTFFGSEDAGKSILRELPPIPVK